ncbi:hypothetical protein [uncultured Friedmanniella sp.]|uniref:hypothetical protein n=1 Tax=uncultured Friedmanniella sp. TaxID=335381 RepID=UPI0035CA3227
MNDRRAVDTDRNLPVVFEVDSTFPLPVMDDLARTEGRWTTAEEEFEDVYLDTPSSHLAQFGITLRYRERAPALAGP